MKNYESAREAFFRAIALVFCVVLIILFLPLGAFATEYTRLGNLASVADGTHQKLNTVKVSVNGVELNAGDTVLVRLPKGFCFN